MKINTRDFSTTLVSKDILKVSEEETKYISRKFEEQQNEIISEVSYRLLIKTCVNKICFSSTTVTPGVELAPLLPTWAEPRRQRLDVPTNINTFNQNKRFNLSQLPFLYSTSSKEKLRFMCTF